MSLEPPEATGWRPILKIEGKKVYEAGSIILVPHMFLSLRRHFRKAELTGSRTLSANQRAIRSKRTRGDRVGPLNTGDPWSPGPLAASKTTGNADSTDGNFDARDLTQDSESHKLVIQIRDHFQQTSDWS